MTLRAAPKVALGKRTAPASVPARLYLLACDPTTGRLAGGSRLGLVLRAAALVDLQFSGHLVDDNGRVAVKTGPTPADPVLAGVLEGIGASGPRKWGYWVGRRPRAMVRDVRDELVRSQVIRVEPYRRYGVVPAERITVRQPLLRRQLLQAATDTLRPARLVTRVDLADAALAVLAATGDLRPILSKDQRTRHKDRLAQLAVRVGPVVPALRKAIQHQSAAASSGG
ncbi:Golgi phosphoprotein 3 GPP34 [Kribbella amoyensis]|uniref:Golgi phosphoprotein 3 GPP34 n=1 Tax=Kribbella amoyensis TaxID=996641 RepID=A0A561BK06_9ACTN|nr:GPP34 family phosphoprotein [Kribbella amoyensis]TWD79190.1 Golgi phosphoprotein 3 GPP34 [Kribbella amoyensis]